MISLLSDLQLKHLRPTHAVVDLDRLACNIGLARQLAGTDIIAIVKADGYGHGAQEVARHAFECCDVRNFGVATVEEAITLRRDIRNPKNVRIIVLGYVDEIFYPDVLANRITLTVYDHKMATCLNTWLDKEGKTLQVSLKIDTGMGRLGFPPTLDLKEFNKLYPNLEIQHIMSHLAASDNDPEYSATQEALFDEFLSKNPGNFDTSLFNSSAIANYSNKYTLVRPGLLIYGYACGAQVDGLKPVMSIVSKVIHVLKLKRGDSVSYNRRFIADKDMWAGVVPIGYADGYRRGLANGGVMYIDGVSCPILGSVCMDMTMIDISRFGENALGREVEIMGDHVSAADIATCVDTIEYEILCGISMRIPRVYKGGGG